MVPGMIVSPCDFLSNYSILDDPYNGIEDLSIAFAMLQQHLR